MPKAARGLVNQCYYRAYFRTHNQDPKNEDIDIPCAVSAPRSSCLCASPRHKHASLAKISTFNPPRADGRSADAESAGCFTMTDIYNFRGTVSSGGVRSSKGPIFQLDDDGAVVEEVGAVGEPVTNKWLLTAELYVTNGAIFYCKGTSAGGDCDELRIQSTGPEDWYELRGHGGSLYFEETKVTSWDTPNRAPQVRGEGGGETVKQATLEVYVPVRVPRLNRPPPLATEKSGGQSV